MPTISTDYQGDMLFKTHMGSHELTVDVPPGMGGQDRGPQPPELFVASLGSCVGALVAEYCRNKGLDAQGMRVDVEFEKASEPTRLTHVRVVTHLPNADCRERRCHDALVNVARQCPVHKTIETVDEVRFDIVGRDGG